MVYMKKIIYFLFFLFISMNAVAQHQKYIHQTFELDTATTLVLDLYGEFVIEKWVGSSVMIETKASLYDASEAVFEHFLEQGRYLTEVTLEAGVLKLTSKDKERKEIKTSAGPRREEVQVRVFIPKNLQEAGTNTWTVPEKEAPREITKKGDGENPRP